MMENHYINSKEYEYWQTFDSSNNLIHFKISKEYEKMYELKKWLDYICKMKNINEQIKCESNKFNKIIGQCIIKEKLKQEYKYHYDELITCLLNIEKICKDNSGVE